ncbi:MAG: exodeoxyribonuclease VII small subunit [Eubacteriales bacterium]|nr:exodeoxyribonuclease VII small subunit [Eubacteriales bacterium]
MEDIREQTADAAYSGSGKEEAFAGAPDIEQSFERLDALLSEMETPDCTLEKSFRLYEEGVKLIASARQQINKVEQQLRVLNGDGEADPKEQKDGI